MDCLQEFNKIMMEEKEIALATSTSKPPNVRIKNFYYNPEHKGVLYFSTFKGNNKTKEFLENNIVAFSTIPKLGNGHVRVKGGTVEKSNLSIHDIKDEFIKKSPDFEMTVKHAGEQLEIYEVHFNEATLILDFMTIVNVTL